MSTEEVLAIGTRIHLGNASEPPSSEDLKKKVRAFMNTVQQAVRSHLYAEVKAAIAVDASEDKIKGFNLPKAIQMAVNEEVQKEQNGNKEELLAMVEIEVLPLSPWGNFVPALNYLLSWAASATPNADHILFISAEMKMPAETVKILHSHLIESDTLVVGVALPGHDFVVNCEGHNHCTEVSLTGRTSPWNTLAMWNVSKLALTGFPMVGEGVHRINAKGGSCNQNKCIAGGVEEVSTIAVLQNILCKTCKAKVVAVPGIIWEQHFDDKERRIWHEKKMKSKESRPAKHLELLNLKGYVIHIC